MAFDYRFKDHQRNHIFANCGELERAILINGITREKALFLGMLCIIIKKFFWFLEGILIMANKLRQHLLNKTTEWRNILACIKYQENELTHEKVLLKKLLNLIMRENDDLYERKYCILKYRGET